MREAGLAGRFGELEVVLICEDGADAVATRFCCLRDGFVSQGFGGDGAMMMTNQRGLTA